MDSESLKNGFVPSISCSLVLYNNEVEQFERAIGSYLASCSGRLYVVDNSPKPLRSELFNHSRVVYFFLGNNIGFGAGHNMALSKISPDTDFHLILNPDIEFEAEVLSFLSETLSENLDAGVVMPRVIYRSGQTQNLCKLLPTPIDLFARRFLPSKLGSVIGNKYYVLRNLPVDKVKDIPSLSGCFLLVRTELFLRLGGFDEQFFMYMEDVDLVRRIGVTHRTIYDPRVTICHGYQKGSYKNIRLLIVHIVSAVKYFNKWGWYKDDDRACVNKKCLADNAGVQESQLR